MAALLGITKKKASPSLKIDLENVHVTIIEPWDHKGLSATTTLSPDPGSQPQ